MSAALRPAPVHAAPRSRVLVLDDEESLRRLLEVILDQCGCDAVLCADGLEGVAALDGDPSIRVAFCDLRMPRMDGLAFLERVRDRGLRVVMMSAYGTTDTAVQALARGAYDYVSKPFLADEIRICVERIRERDRLEAENRSLRERVEGLSELEGFVGASAAAREVVDVVARVAAYPSTVLVTGASGTGKELVARALHARSPRALAPFVAVNCAAIPETLLESELFGHERGAFTGAVRAHQGMFEQAHGGTLFLDEIGEMPLQLQARLLRVLEDGQVRRIGGDSDVAVDVRVVSATSRDLEAEAADGRFRQDLFYRLNVVHVRVPPLSARLEDVPLLCEVLVARAAVKLGRPVAGVTPEALRALVAHPWPGNVRQLENALERAVIMTTGPTVGLDDLPADVRAPVSAPAVVADDDDLSIKRRTAFLERDLIARALERTGGNRSQAARLLEISYKALVYKIREYGLDT